MVEKKYEIKDTYEVNSNFLIKFIQKKLNERLVYMTMAISV